MADFTSDPAVGVCFMVSVDGRDLGVFTSCDGLGCEITVEQREEGGNPDFIYQLPGRLKYTNVKLTRPINRDTEKVARWFAAMTTKVERTQAHIAAMTLGGKKVAVWNLTGVIPVRWSGPQLGVDNSKVATETIEIAHHGFTFDGRG